MIQRYQKGSRMSQAVSYGGLVYIAGQVAENRKADIEEQTRDVLGKIDALLQQAGTDRSRLLAVNVFLARRQALSLERARHVDDETVLAAVPARTAGAAGSDARVDVEAAIATLPPGAKVVFVLHDVEGYRHEEIAGFLGVTTGTTKAQLHRARMLLRGHLTA